MRPPVHRLVSWSFLSASVVVLLTSSGCPSSGAVDSTPPAKRLSVDTGEISDLASKIDRVLADNLARRQFDVTTHGAWQILHGILAYDEAFQVRTPTGTTSAIEYLLQGNPLEGFRPGWARDLSEQLGTTGHVLEFVAFADDDSTLRAPWVKRSAHRICDLLEQCREVDLECGVLYHAIHGLQEYRSRMMTSL